MKTSSIKTNPTTEIKAIQSRLLKNYASRGKSKKKGEEIDIDFLHGFDFQAVNKRLTSKKIDDLAWNILSTINSFYRETLANEILEEYGEHDGSDEFDQIIDRYCLTHPVFNPFRLQLVMDEERDMPICISSYIWSWYLDTESLETGNIDTFCNGKQYSVAFGLMDKVVKLVEDFKAINHLKAILPLQRGEFYSLWECRENRYGYASDSPPGSHIRSCVKSPGKTTLTNRSINFQRNFGTLIEDCSRIRIEASPIITKYAGKTENLSDEEKEGISNKLAIEILQDVSIFYDRYNDEEREYIPYTEEYICATNPAKIQLIKLEDSKGIDGWIAISNFYCCITNLCSDDRNHEIYKRDGYEDEIKCNHAVKSSSIILQKLGFLMYELKAYDLIEDILPLQAGECDSFWNELPQSREIYKSRELRYTNHPESAIRLIGKSSLKLMEEWIAEEDEE